MIREVSKIKYVYELLTPRIRGAIMSVPEIERDRIQEIRLRRVWIIILRTDLAEVDGCLLPYSRKSISLMITAD